jgi:ATP-dependent DNA helicase RecG
MNEPVSAPASVPVTALHGIGPARAAALARRGVHDLRGLALLAPLRLECVGPRVELAQLAEHAGREVSVRGAVRACRLVRQGPGRSAVRVTLEDRSGRGDALFFNQPWMRDALPLGTEVELYGRVVDQRGPVLASPRRVEVDDPDHLPGALLPIYPAVEGLSPRHLRELARAALARLEPLLGEPLPAALLAQLELPPLPQAARQLHTPTSPGEFERAKRRLVFEPLLRLQARLQQRLQDRAAGRAQVVRIDGAQHRELIGLLPFEPTAGQLEVLAEVRRDLARPAPMGRLLQGDVGSGKTALGVYACAAVARAGAQAAFLAPTELLAEQHFAGQAPLLARFGVRAALLTGSQSPAQRRRTLEDLAAGRCQVVFGTHALFSPEVRFARLALAVIDEQHRFGVAQRQRLLEKGRDVHVLLMTATPIPRTLALTLYGDLETSALRERPPGRAAIDTRWVPPREGPAVLRAVEARLVAGERAYWVCPRIDTSDQGRGVEEAYARLADGPLARFGLECVHGRLPPAERGERLDRFRRGSSGLLVGTTVIEVGVDVPEATVMVIEGAERLGLAQLHQLRGRVGRSHRPSQCFLFGAAAARERLELLQRCSDGFALAEHDLTLRGMGDLFGARQAGENFEGLLDPQLDLDLIQRARDAVARDPALRAHYLAQGSGLSRG